MVYGSVDDSVQQCRKLNILQAIFPTLNQRTISLIYQSCHGDFSSTLEALLPQTYLGTTTPTQEGPLPLQDSSTGQVPENASEVEESDRISNQTAAHALMDLRRQYLCLPETEVSSSVTS